MVRPDELLDRRMGSDVVTALCAGCGGPFTPVRPGQTACRPSCARTAQRARDDRPLFRLADRPAAAPAPAEPDAVDGPLTFNDLPF